MESQKKLIPIIPLVSTATISVLIILSYWPVLMHLFKYISKDDDYSFGLIIPFVVGYIVYLKWSKILDNLWQPSWLGLLVIAAGYFLYALGEILTSFYITCFSLVVVITGLLLVLGRWELVKIMSFPILLLILMIPSNTWFIRKVSLQLQLISSGLAAWLLNSVGIPVLRQGNVIDLGVHQLEVVAACSGLRYILSLLTLSIIYCYFYQRRAWKAGILIISVVPAAIIANAVRVAAMGLFPSLQEEGFWHNFSGWLIFIGCFGFLVFVNWILNYLRPQVWPPEVVEVAPKLSAPPGPHKSVNSYLIFGLVLIILMSPIPYMIARVPTMSLLQNFDQFPLTFGLWHGQRSYIDRKTIKALGTEDYIDATFVSPENKSVSLWIAYYGNMKEKGGLLHSPFVCMTGGGWVPIESKEVEMLPGKPVSYLLMEQGDKRIVVYYWYIQRGRWLPNEYFNKYYLGLDSLLKSRADGALIRLTTPVESDIESARKLISDFARPILPILKNYIPS
ncbi:MAG: EpsI family protein [Candidatus Schekmanbacteria bacterium]|nr:EpsI family protein [Candidatus Schekmanbacteria bacterium]